MQGSPQILKAIILWPSVEGSLIPSAREWELDAKCAHGRSVVGIGLAHVLKNMIRQMPGLPNERAGNATGLFADILWIILANDVESKVMG